VAEQTLIFGTQTLIGLEQGQSWKKEKLGMECAAHLVVHQVPTFPQSAHLVPKWPLLIFPPAKSGQTELNSEPKQVTSHHPSSDEKSYLAV